MTRSFPRLSIKDSFRIEGPGLHSGEPVAVSLEPSTNGIVFVSGKKEIPAHVANVTDTSRCTQLGELSTVEHVLSALAGLGVTDCHIVLDGMELPAADGCSTPFVNGILEAGLDNVGSLEIEGLFDRVYHVDGDIKLAIGLGDGHWGYEFNLENYFLGQTTYEWHGSAAQYAAEIAPARTVVLEEELEAVKQYGLGKGLDESSCLGIGFKSFLNEPRFPDEPTRHKMLDLIGDLALAGIPAQLLNVQAVRSGHKSNVVAAAKLAERVIIRRINSS